MGFHICLLGDSIFDNSAYTRGDPDVVTHLRALLPSSCGATLCAVDGAVTASLGPQIACIPPATTHVVVSIGGNDALQNSDLLSLRVSSMAEGLDACAERIDRFERAYRSAIDPVVQTGLDVTLCTIYNGTLAPEEARIARVGLMLFNDVILRTALDHRTGIIDLRSVCNEARDYANPIEPSGAGGLKIAKAIAHAVGAVTSARK